MLVEWKNIKVIYVAGPFRGDSSWEMETNIRRAEALALEVWRLPNAAAICPHANTRFFQYELPDEVWLEGDLAMLKVCHACLMTEDWERSEGARAEHDFCEEHGIPIFYDLNQLKDWLATQQEGEKSLADKLAPSVTGRKKRLENFNKAYGEKND